MERRAEAHAHYAAGVIREMNDDPKAALDEYCQAAMLDPDDEALDSGSVAPPAAEPSSRSGRWRSSSARRRGRTPRAQIYARLGLIYSQLGKTEQAAAANREAIKKSPGSLIGYQNLFLGYMRNKQPQEPLNVLDEAARQPDADAEFLVGLAELYVSVGAQAPAQKESSQGEGARRLEPRREAGSDDTAAALEAGGRLQPAGRVSQSRAALPGGAQAAAGCADG